MYCQVACYFLLAFTLTACFLALPLLSMTTFLTLSGGEAHIAPCLSLLLTAWSRRRSFYFVDCLVLVPLSPPAFWESRTHYHRLIGVFWLRPGDDRLDVVLVSRVSAELRRVLCCGSGLDSVDDHCRTLLPGSTPRCHVHCCAYKLDGQLPCWYWLPNHEGTVSRAIWNVCCGFTLFHSIVYYNSHHTFSLLLTVFST